MVHEEKVSNQPIRLRLKFSKTGRLRYISHLDLVRTMTKAVIRAGIPCWYTQGFNPIPKIVFATPMSVGMESLAEIVEIRLASRMDPAEALSRLNQAVPSELCFYEAYEPESKLTDLRYAEYEVILTTEIASPETVERIRALLRDPTLKCSNLTHGKKRERIVGEQTGDAEVELADDGTIRFRMTLGASQGDYLNPEYVMLALGEHLPILLGSPMKNHTLVRRLRVLDSDRRDFR